MLGSYYDAGMYSGGSKAAFWAVAAFFFLIVGLNFFWYSLIIKGVVKMLSGEKKKPKSS